MRRRIIDCALDTAPHRCYNENSRRDSPQAMSFSFRTPGPAGSPAGLPFSKQSLPLPYLSYKGRVGFIGICPSCSLQRMDRPARSLPRRECLTPSPPFRPLSSPRLKQSAPLSLAVPSLPALAPPGGNEGLARERGATVCGFSSFFPKIGTHLPHPMNTGFLAILEAPKRAFQARTD